MHVDFCLRALFELQDLSASLGYKKYVMPKKYQAELPMLELINYSRNPQTRMSPRMLQGTAALATNPSLVSKTLKAKSALYPKKQILLLKCLLLRSRILGLGFPTGSSTQ